VIISSTGRAKLVDFGLAGVDESGDKVLGRVEKPRTIDYVALEKMAGVRDDSVRSDIYFLGTVAYLALAGAAPLTESRDRSVRGDPRRFTQAVPLGQRCPDLPRDVGDVVSRMMHVDPLERYQTATDVKLALEAVIARQGSSEAPPTASPAIAAAKPAAPAAVAAASKGSVMLVESGEKAQQALREFFSKLGFRVLLTENPQRALARFTSVPFPADCLIVCAQSLGASAVEAFNAVSADPSLADLPAIAFQETPRAIAIFAVPFHPASVARKISHLVEPAGIPRLGDKLAVGQHGVVGEEFQQRGIRQRAALAIATED
jgi:CheY-like chemotaxis protein